MAKLREKYGYQYSFFENIVKLFVKFLGKILFLNNNSFYANEFNANLNPTGKINFDGKKLYFRAGHNRLKYRFNGGLSEEPIMVEWIKKFTSNDVVLDIGATVGNFTIPALSKNAFVYAIELDVRNAGILFENLYLNNYLKNCLVLPIAIGKINGVEKIYYRDFSVGDAMQSISREQRLPVIKNNPFEIDQPVFNLDYLFESLKLKQPNKIKIDVDGNENIVFEGGRKTILGSREIYLEDNALEGDEFIFKEIMDAGFKLVKESFSVNPPKGVKNKLILVSKD